MGKKRTLDLGDEKIVIEEITQEEWDAIPTRPRKTTKKSKKT